MATVRQTEPAEVHGALAAPAGNAQVDQRGFDRPTPVQLAPVPPTPIPPIFDLHAIDKRVEALLKQVHANRPSDDIALIRKAWDFCVRHHEGQMRASGEPYIVHPLEVAEVLADMRMDSTSIAAGLLHDSVEDTPATNEEIEAGFGPQVARIVEGVTNIDKIEFANREDRQAENVRKMLLAMVSDVRVVLIKLADRLHNMRTLEHLRPERQEAIARESTPHRDPSAISPPLCQAWRPDTTSFQCLHQHDG